MGQATDEAKAVTSRHREIIEHSLGNKTHYRNYYATEPGDTEIAELVEMGLMHRGVDIPGGLRYFHVTAAGKAIAFK